MRSWPIFVLVIIVIAAAYLFAYVHDTKVEHGFEQVRTGMTEQQVLSVMGKPNSAGRCGRVGGFPNGCAQEYLFNARRPLGAIAGVRWAVFFDGRGTVLEKYQYVSP